MHLITMLAMAVNHIYNFLPFDHWPWPFAWTSLESMVITSENFMMNVDSNIVKKVSQTDRQMDGSVLTAAWSQLKTHSKINNLISTNFTKLVIYNQQSLAITAWTEAKIKCPGSEHWLKELTPVGLRAPSLPNPIVVPKQASWLCTTLYNTPMGNYEMLCQHI